ncbi:adenylosuccinate lyase family protein [Thalassococcus sp. S3]|uniref:class-II fumarase/aspartase family protein n=1 Tax=Thalassococcus sp. S3 TaxID=2017482 RepID=UPI0010242861|nr:adenylosuccinate lyase family protein [Thalassococcus sp. S3]QBF30712.1 3-carboxy-cis,cis-muconate cycloisomerase [Thalassococcus sp. S3]
MAGAVQDSLLFSDLFPTGDVGRLFSDTAALRAMLLVEGALAKVQAAQGIIPEVSAHAIQRAAMEVQVDPAALTAETGQNGVSIPALLRVFRQEMQAPEHAQYVHWGATSQDIIDTGLMLRLRQTLALFESDLKAVLQRLATLCEENASTPMPARTYGQPATPTSFGAAVAEWGAPLLALLNELEDLRAKALLVSLSGAAGTASALGPAPAETRAALADALGLGDPGRSWHTDRTPVLKVADWAVRLCLSVGKIGEDVRNFVDPNAGFVRLDAAGSSSTMPQKQNPVAASVLIATARHVIGLNSTLQGAAIHRDQRDGAAWFTEWMCLPQILLGTATSLQAALPMLEQLVPQPAQMAAGFDPLGLIHAEQLSFALAARMPRPEAQAATKALCQEASKDGVTLQALVARDWPELEIDAIFDPARSLGNAPDDAQRFARKVRETLAGHT